MRARLAAFLATTSIATALVALAPVSPASADTNVCAGQGSLTTGPLVYPVTATTAPSVTINQPRTVAFAFGIGIGTCAPDLGKSLTATGTLTGWCGLWSGQGITGQGHQFAWLAAGGVAVFTGELDGVALVTPNVLAGQSCLTGATSFLVTLVALLRHCLILKSKNLHYLSVVPSTLTKNPPVWIHTGPPSIHYRTCL